MSYYSHPSTPLTSESQAKQSVWIQIGSKTLKRHRKCTRCVFFNRVWLILPWGFIIGKAEKILSVSLSWFVHFKFQEYFNNIYIQGKSVLLEKQTHYSYPSPSIHVPIHLSIYPVYPPNYITFWLYFCFHTTSVLTNDCSVERGTEIARSDSELLNCSWQFSLVFRPSPTSQPYL